MSIRSIPRTAVDTGMKLSRLPLDVAVSLLPGNGTGEGVGPAAGVAIDRLDATLRDAAGIALRDSALRDDAARRRIAADERARALRLRANADRRSTQADERFSARIDDAEERRAAAERRADDERAAARQRKRRRTAAAAGTEQRRKVASRKARTKVAEAIDEDADAARLEQLRAEAKVLEERDAALAAQAEAQRLQDEATKKKAARKAG